MFPRIQHSPQEPDPVVARDAGASVESTTPSRATLQSWKEIASELNRGVRTVQRWERMLGLPVRRVGKGRRCPVFAFKDELQRWLRSNTNAHTPDQQGFLQSIQALFSQENSPHTKRHCDKCCSRMTFLNGHFWLYGTKKNWTLSVPFCPLCDADALEGFRHSPTVQ